MPYDPALPLLGIYLEKTLIKKKNTCISVVTAVLFTITKKWKQPKCPLIDEWMKRIWSIYRVYTQWDVLNHLNEIMPFAAICMDLEIIILSEVNQTKTDII